MGEWVDNGLICSVCDYNGEHLEVEPDLLICGQCKHTL